MTLRLSTRYALLLITFGTLFHIHAQPLPAVSDCNTAAVADSSTMPRPADYPSALRQRVDSLLRPPLLEHSQLGLCVYDLTADSLLMDCGQHQCLRPASCQKVITAVAALTQLGTDYMLRTPLGYKGTVADSICFMPFFSFLSSFAREISSSTSF